jgi:hypothetical protein
METALEAYYAQNGTSADPTEAQLVTADFLVAESVKHNISSGVATTFGDASVVIDATADEPCT